MSTIFVYQHQAESANSVWSHQLPKPAIDHRLDTPSVASAPVNALTPATFHKLIVPLPDIIRHLTGNGWFGCFGHLLVAQSASRQRLHILSRDAEVLDHLSNLIHCSVWLHQQATIRTQCLEHFPAAGQDPSPVGIGQPSQPYRIRGRGIPCRIDTGHAQRLAQAAQCRVRK